MHKITLLTLPIMLVMPFSAYAAGDLDHNTHTQRGVMSFSEMSIAECDTLAAQQGEYGEVEYRNRMLYCNDLRTNAEAVKNAKDENRSAMNTPAKSPNRSNKDRSYNNSDINDRDYAPAAGGTTPAPTKWRTQY